jgi:protein-disulfide isomerase
VTDKMPPSQSDADRESPAAEADRDDADLDADLWPDPIGVTGQATRPVITNDGPRISARDRIRIERERVARRRRWIRLSMVSTGVLVLAAAATAIGITSHHGRHAPAPAPAPFGYQGPYAPVTLNVDNSVTMARPGVTEPIVDIYEDFQCPECRTFEKSDGAVIQQLADQGKVKVVYYPFTIFAGQPELANSVRAWTAARCAPPSRWVKYHNVLYANQPAQTTSDGFPVSQLIQLGKDAGITSPAFAQCVRSQQYAAQDAPLSDQIINAGMSTMPDVTLDGKALGADLTPSALRKLILARSAKAKPPAKKKPAVRGGVTAPLGIATPPRKP